MSKRNHNLANSIPESEKIILGNCDNSFQHKLAQRLRQSVSVQGLRDVV